MWAQTKKEAKEAKRQRQQRRGQIQRDTDGWLTMKACAGKPRDPDLLVRSSLVALAFERMRNGTTLWPTAAKIDDWAGGGGG
jgi:hypothetical protein